MPALVLQLACQGPPSEAPPPADPTAPAPARTSSLWGEEGELWKPAGRLADFSFAGYHAGEEPLPEPPVRANVREHGAVGDGVADDTDAFVAAIAAVSDGAIFVPSGRYRITRPLHIDKSRIVLRGENRDTTVLYFPKTLLEVLGEGKDGGPHGWSWGGAWVWVNGDPSTGDSTRLTWNQGELLATVTAPAARGARSLTVSDTSRIVAGQRIRLVERESDGSLSLELHAGYEFGARCQMNRPGQQVVNRMVVVAAIDGNTIELDRPLLVPMGPKWKAEIWSFEPQVEEVGIEHLTFEFPLREYPGHHNEPGQSAVSLAAAYNSWVRDVAILNADNGISFWYSKNCTAEGVTLAGRGGHYGINLAGGQDCLLTRFRIQNISLHDLSVANLGNGNVASWGKGVAINFDHHRYAPHDNLWSNIEVGESWRRRRLWHSSATRSGHYTAAYETYWNLRPQVVAFRLPDWPAMNLIGPLRMKADMPPTTKGQWIEPVDGLQPVDLHAAQLARRLGRPVPPPLELPAPVPGFDRIPVFETIQKSAPSSGQPR